MEDFRNELLQHARARRSWPGRGHDQGDTSGINCMLLLLKYMVTLLGRPFWEQNVLDQMPFIRQAWKDFTDPATATIELESLVLAVWNQPLHQLPAGEANFANIVSSEQMREFWGAQFCHPWRRPLWKLQFQESWHPVDEQQTPQRIFDAIGTSKLNLSPSNFRLEASPDMILAKQIKSCFGFLEDQGVQVALPALPSAFFFATFDVCGVTSTTPLDFNNFRTFELGVVDPTQRTTARLRYNLLAIVRPRDARRAGTDGAHDTIRVYNRDGAPEPSRAPDSAYANPSWTLADMTNGDTFFAVWAKSWLPPVLDPPFPETAAEIMPRKNTGAGKQIAKLIDDLNATSLSDDE